MPDTDSVHSAPSLQKEAATATAAATTATAAPTTGGSGGGSSPEAKDEYADAEANFDLRSAKFWLIMLGMYASVFLVALDRMIIATAIPSITDEFGSIADIGWYGSAYMLTAAVFNPLFGRLYQLYSTKWTFLASIVVFEAGSALCGAAPSSAAFIVGRAVAGIGAAGIFTGGIMITVPLVPLRRRPVFNSMFGVAFGLSSIIGPLVGGAFTDNIHLTWRWCFYVNLPIGAFTVLAVLLFLQIESPKREKLSAWAQVKRLDPLGLLFFAPSMICLILALQWGGTRYAWSEPRMVGLLATFAVTLVAFVAVEALLPATAMAPARVVLNRSVGSGMLFVFLLSGGMMLVVYYLTIWFQAAQGRSALESGVRTLPMVLSLVVFSVAAAVFTQKVGYYNPAMILSPVLCAAAGGLLSTLTPDAPASHWVGYQLMYGIGLGVGFQNATLIPQVVLPRADVALGTGMMMFMQQLGGSVFLSVGQNVFARRLVADLRSVPGVDAAAVLDTGATALRAVVPAAQLAAVVDRYSYALTRVFVLSAGLSAGMILGTVVLEWKSIKAKKAAAADGAAAEKAEEIEAKA